MFSKKQSANKFFILVAALSIFLILSITPTFAQGNQSIYRLYNPATGEHLYTTQAAEVNSLVRNAGWKSEGTGWVAPSEGEPVYRLFNGGINEHLYTKDVNEKNSLAGQGWSIDNGDQPLFYSGGEIPIYRLYHEGSMRHHLTTDANEYNALPGQGWKQEGVGFNAVANGSLDGPNTIANTDCVNAIQTDVTLSGSGAGYHAKVLAQTPTSAVSFGLQFDTGGQGNYRNNTGFIVENVISNDPGQQQYFRPGLGASNTTYRVMLAVQADGTCTFYVNGVQFGDSIHNPNIVNSRIDMAVEGSGKQNGDSVNAVFSNIEIKNTSAFDANKHWKPITHDTNPSIHSDISAFDSEKKVSISGTVTGLAAGQDWDNAYGQVSGVTTFYDH